MCGSFWNHEILEQKVPGVKKGQTSALHFTHLVHSMEKNFRMASLVKAKTVWRPYKNYLYFKADRSEQACGLITAVLYQNKLLQKCFIYNGIQQKNTFINMLISNAEHFNILKSQNITNLAKGMYDKLYLQRRKYQLIKCVSLQY